MGERFGNYEILRKIASGGMAEVFLAKQTSLGGFERLVCIKRILPHLGEQEDFITMFLDEARIAANLVHPNIAQIYDIGEVDGAYYIAMEYVRGEDLRRVYNQEVARGRPIPGEPAAQIIMYAASGLDYAHRQTTIDGRPMGIVHRDISPQNVLVNYDGHVKVVDFGVAKAVNKVNETRSGVLKGKYSYMSPEQASGDPIDARTDIFALGITLYEVTTGTRLFKRENELETLHAVIACEVTAPSSVIPGYDADLEAVIMRCLAYDPDDRYPTAGELERDLERFLLDRNHPTGPSSLAAYMQDLFADKLADELLFGSQPWEEENTGNHNPNATRKLGPRSDSDAPAAPSFDEDTEVAPEIRLPSSEATEIDDGWRSTHGRHPQHERVKDDWSVESQSQSQTATNKAGTNASETTSAGRGRPAAAPEPSIEPRGRSHWFAMVAIGALVLGVGVGLGLVLTSGGSNAWRGPMSGPVTIDSEPRGARVVFVGSGTADLNRQLEGFRTPITIKGGLPVEVPMRVRIIKQGYEIAETNLPVLQAGVVPRPVYVELTANDASKQQASLIVLSTPSGASVYIDGNKIDGRTPLNDVRVSGGDNHKIALRLTGYQPRRETIYVEPGSRRFIEMTLFPVGAHAATAGQAATTTATASAASPPETADTADSTGSDTTSATPATTPPTTTPDPNQRHVAQAPRAPTRRKKGRGYLSVTAPMQLRVSVGGHFVGTTPIRRFAVDSGVHRLTLESVAEGFTLRRKVRVGPGHSTDIDLRPAKGNMSLNASPWAWVRVGKRPPAETPVRLSVYEGDYTVVFECPNGQRKHQSVHVVPGQTASASISCQ